MPSSPIRRRAAASSPSAGSASRSLSAPSSAASAFRRHCSSLTIGRPSSRESSSADSPRSRRRTTSRLRTALQRWPGASGPGLAAAGAVPTGPVDSVDGLRPPSLTTGPSAAFSGSISFMLDFTMPVSCRTNGCPRKPGAAHRFVAVNYAWRGADAGSAILQRELEALYPVGSEAPRLVETLTKAGFDCGSYFSSRTWRGCHVEARNFWGPLAVIRVRVDSTGDVITGIHVDMSFPAFVW